MRARARLVRDPVRRIVRTLLTLILISKLRSSSNIPQVLIQIVWPFLVTP